jgi:uroporphyrin-3 C-methyltransferase
MSEEQATSRTVPLKPGAAGVALIVALLALGAGGYGLWLGSDASRRVRALEAAQSHTEQARSGDSERLGGELAALKHTLEGESQRHADSDALGRTLREEVLGLSERAGLMEDALRSLAERKDDGEVALRLSEAEFLLRLGSERYGLFHDPASAREAFRLADGTLAALDDPLFAGVRQTIAAELAELESAPAPDRTGLVARLDALDVSLAGLPFGGNGETRTAAEPEQGWFARVRAAFADAVRIRRVASGETAMLGPANAALARQAVALDLALAKAAVAAGDDARAHTAIGSAARRVAQWLPADDARVKSFRGALDEINAALPEHEQLKLGKAQAELGNLRAARTLSVGLRAKAKGKPTP